MNSSSRWLGLLRRDDAVVAVVVAAFLATLVGLAGAAVDVGIWYATRAELQNAADAAALAAANTLITNNSNGVAVAQPSAALITAKNYALANVAHGKGVIMLDSDFVAGFWDTATATITAQTGTDPANFNAVRVILRRDGVANQPVATVFARIFGLNSVNVRVSSVAYVGYAGSTTPGQVDLPICIWESAVTGGNCTDVVVFNDDNSQTAMWTEFSTQNANSSDIKPYVDGPDNGGAATPAVNVGDQFRVTNGTLGGLFDELKARFQAEATGGEWRVLLPVIKDIGSNTAEVVGFVPFVISEVYDQNDHPPSGKSKMSLYGHMECDQVTVPNAPPGGGAYGARAGSGRSVS